MSSKNFSPSAFLRDVHGNTPSPALEQGLNSLSQSIAQKSGSLKDLVENNFDRFVAAKGTIEGVYKEMKDNSFLAKDKESEYGVGKIRTYLNEISLKADEVYGPIMTGRGKEDRLRLLLGLLDKHSKHLELPGVLADCVKRNDYDTLLDEYQKARKFLDDSRALVPNPKSWVQAGTKEEHIHQLVIAERMWLEVIAVTDRFKKATWKKLIDCKADDRAHLEIIGILLELGIEENPISVWLISRYDALKSQINNLFERSRVDIEILRRKVSATPKARPQTIAQHLRSPSRRLPVDSLKSFDIPVINCFWEVMYGFLCAMLDSSTGVLSELLGLWKAVRSFVDGVNTLPDGINDQSKKHHRLSDDDIQTLRDGTLELANLIRSYMVSFFNNPPVDDISALYCSPLTTPVSATIQKDGGEDEYSFFPPGGNSLGGIHYMGKSMILLGRAAAAMSEAFSELGSATLQDDFRSMLSVARERSVKAVGSAWLADVENCKVMEDWTRAMENRGVTKMPGYFLAFEKEVISGMQSIVYLDKVRNGNTGVIPPPSAKFLTNVRSQFVQTLYKALQGMVENAKQPLDSDEDSYNLGMNSSVTSTRSANLTVHSVDSRNQNVRMLLTLSNLQLLKAEVVPELIMQFENSFSVKLTGESKTIRDALSQIDAQLFEEYTKPIVDNIATIIRKGISSPSWSPAPGKLASEVRPYIYDALLAMVDVHAQVSTTAPSLVQQVLSYLLEQLSRGLLEGFKKRKTFTLGELLQATLDVEFVNQTLSQFNTPKSSEWQQLVYVELDRGSDCDARQGLQKELGEMKRILGSLRRYSRAEFLCFRAKKSSARRTNPDHDPEKQ